MTNWIKYGLIYISAGCTITGVWKWWTEGTGIVRAEHLAEIRAHVEELGIAYLEGTDTPNSHLVERVTNVVTCVSPSVEASAQVEAGATNFFTASDSGFKIIRIRMSESAGTTLTQFLIKLDGNNAGQIFAVPIASNAAAYAGSDYDDGIISIHPYAAWIPRGGYYDYQVRPATPPPSDVDSTGRVGPWMLWDDIYLMGMCKLRDYALDHYGAGRVFWAGTTNDVSDGDVIAHADVSLYLSASNTAGAVKYYTYTESVSNRFSETLTTAAMRDGAGFTFPNSSASPGYTYRPTSVLTGTNLPIAAKFYAAANNATNDVYGVSGNWWTANAISTNRPFAFGCERVSNGVVRTSVRWVSTNNLNECKRIADGLTRTVAVLPFSYMTATGMTLTTVESVTNVGGLAFGVRRGIDKTGVSAALEAGAATSSTNAGALSATLLTCSMDASYEYGQGHDGADDYDTSAASLSETLRRYEGCTLRYPCAYAFASGYVARVRIYAVGGSAGEVDTGPSLRGHGTDGEIGSAVAGAFYWPRPYDQQDNLHGILEHGYGYSSAVQILGTTFTEQRTGDGFPQTPNAYRLSLLADSGANPVAFPAFSLGTATPYFPGVDVFSLAEWSYADGQAPDPWWTVNMSEFGFYQSIDIACFVVVTDWKWKHMNEANPYEPDPYTPPWVTNNVVTNGF